MIGPCQIIGRAGSIIFQIKQYSSHNFYCLKHHHSTMAGFSKTFAAGLRKLDLFPSGQFLRYKSEPYYKTTTGGVISIVILAIFVVLFASTALETLNRQIVISTSQIERQIDPVPTQISFDAYNGFSFALVITLERASGMLDLNNESLRYFDVELKHWQKQPDYSYLPTDLPLTGCTVEHFARSPEIVEQLPSALIHKMACPDFSSSSFTIQGARVTSTTSYIELNIKKCNSSRHSNCIGDDKLRELQASSGGKFEALIFLMGNTISPESQQYRQPFIDSRKRLSFTLTDGLEADIYLEEDIVKTDHSLTPIPDVEVEKVLTVEDFVLTRPTSTQNNNFMSIIIGKSPLQRTYYRSFQKIDTFFSYVGGIIGTIIGLLFVMNFYSRQAYSISIASQLYLSEQGDKISSSSFHIGYFFLIPFKKVLNALCCCSFKWAKTDFYTRCIDQANQQLDVLTLMKKIVFLEKAMTFLFQDHQLQALFLFEKENIDAAEKGRKKHEINQKLHASGGSKVTPVNPKQQKPRSSLEKPQINEAINSPNAFLTDQELSGKSYSEVDARSRQRIKTQMGQLVRDSLQGNEVSDRIAKSIDPGVLATMGLNYEQMSQDETKRETFMSPRVHFKRRRPLDPIPERGDKKDNSSRFGTRRKAEYVLQSSETN